MPEIDDILKDRGSRYGDFGVQAEVAQQIRDSFVETPNWDSLPDYMKEALTLMATKFSRMLTGDPMYMDNVVDLIGYMTLVKDQMDKEYGLMQAEMEKYLARVEEDETTAKIRQENFRKAAAHAQSNFAEQGANSDNVAEHSNPLNWTGPYGDRQPG